MADQNKKEYRAGSFENEFEFVDGVIQYLKAPVGFVHGCAPRMIDADGYEIVAHQPVKAKHFEADHAVWFDHRENNCLQAMDYWMRESQKFHVKATEWRAMSPDERTEAAEMDSLLRKVAKFSNAKKKIFCDKAGITVDSLSLLDVAE